MLGCSVLECHNYILKVRPTQDPPVSFHRFPLDPTLRGKWLKAIGRKSWIPKSNSAVCSLHFKPSDFDQIKSPGTLKDNAIPSTSNSLTVSRKSVEAAAVKQTVGFVFEAVVEPELRSRDIQTVNDLVQKLVDKKIITLALADLLLEKYGGMLISEVARSSGRGTNYTAKEKEFALALYCHSRLGYNLVRTLWWMPAESVIVGNLLKATRFQPGISVDILSALSMQIEKCISLKDAALQLSTIQLSGERQWGSEGPCGEVNLGSAPCADGEDLASHALLIHVVAITSSGVYVTPVPAFSAPVAYFFLPSHGCNHFIANIIKGIIFRLHLIGVRIHAVTAPSIDEWSDVFKILGCQFEGTQASCFYDELGKQSIFVFFDHRQLASKWVEIMGDEKCRLEMPAGTADFKFIQRLVGRVSEIDGAYNVDNAQRCYLGRLLVRLKYHLMSSEVADALEFLRASRDTDFIFCRATIEVLRLVDAVGQCLSVGDFRPAVTKKTMNAWGQLLDDILLRLKNNVQIDGHSALLHPNKSFLAGMVANLASLRGVASRFIMNKHKFWLVPAVFTLERAEEFAARARYFANKDSPNKPPSAAQLQKALMHAYYHPSGCLHAKAPSYYPIAPPPILTISHKYRSDAGVKLLDDREILRKALFTTERYFRASCAVNALVDIDPIDSLVDVLLRSDLCCCDCVTVLFNENNGPVASPSLRIAVKQILMLSRVNRLSSSSPHVVNSVLQDFVDRPLFRDHANKRDAPNEELHSIQLVRFVAEILNEITG